VTSPRVLCRFEDIPDSEAKGFEIPVEGGRPREILVARRGDAAYGYMNVCPHAGTPLDWKPDTFMSWDKRFLLCATHGALFEVETGLCVAGPCTGARLRPVAVALRDGEVVLTDPELAG